MEGDALDRYFLRYLKAAAAFQDNTNPTKAKVQNPLSQYANVHPVSKYWPMLYGRFMLRGAN